MRSLLLVLTFLFVSVPSQTPAPSVTIARIPLVDEVSVTDVAAPVEFKNGKPVAFLPNTWHMTRGGQLCPVSKTEALTARHVAIQSPLMWGYPMSAYGGTVTRVWVDTRRDLGMVRIAAGPAFQRFYAVAKEPPQVGDKVFIQGYDNDVGWTTKWYVAKVTNLYTGNVDYDDTPGPGSSGSCVLNERGEIVGINYAAFQVNPMSPARGSGVLLTPPWGVPGTEWREASGLPGEEKEE